jgi:hypothetical protein
VVSVLPKDLLCSDKIEIIHIPISGQNTNKAYLFYFVAYASVRILMKGMRQRYERFIAFDCHNSAAFFLPKLLQGTHLFLLIRGFYRHQDLFQSNYAPIRSVTALLNKNGYILADRVRFASNAR